MSHDTAPTGSADVVVLTHTPATDRVHEQLTQRSYRGYLRRSKSGSIEVGEEWEEFVSCGCGTTRDVVLRVEETQGGETIDDATAFEFQAREEA